MLRLLLTRRGCRNVNRCVCVSVGVCRAPSSMLALRRHHRRRSAVLVSLQGCLSLVELFRYCSRSLTFSRQF